MAIVLSNNCINEMTYIKCSKCGIVKAYNKDNFNTDRNLHICKECNYKLLTIAKYQRNYNIILSFEELYNTYNIIEWFNFLIDKKIYSIPLLLCTEENAIIIFKYVMENLLKKTLREDIVKTTRDEILFYMPKKLLFKIDKVFYNCLIKTYKELDIKKYELKYIGISYFNNKKKADEYLIDYVDNVISSYNITDYKKQISYFFTIKTLRDLNFYLLYSILSKYKYYSSFYEWVNTIYPQWELVEKDFNLFMGVDNKTKLDSYEEKIIFDYIYNTLNIKTIEGIGVKCNHKFYNESYNENYCPDFKIKDINGVKLKKPLFIEYYGFYNLRNKSTMSFIQSYIDKTVRKNEYFKNRQDIYFIDLYPEDIKNNMLGLNKKLSSFLITKDIKFKEEK